MWLPLLLACAGPDAPTGDTSDTSHGDTSDTSDTSGDDTGGPATRVVLAVSGYFSDAVYLYDRDGTPLGSIPEVDGAQTVVLAPDGTLVACAEERNEVWRVDPLTFAVLGPLIDAEAAAAAGLDGPTAAVFGPDGDLFVGSFGDDRVLRFGPDGTFEGAFVDAGAGGLDGPDIGLAFGPDGHLYVPSWSTGSVLRFDGATGASLGAVVGPEHGLVAPRGLAWDADGALLVASSGSDAILRVDPADGTVTPALASREPQGIVRDGGELLVAEAQMDKVRAYDLTTGEAVGTVVDDPAIEGITSLSLLTLPAP